ncbi:MAG: ABC transporter permease subunit [Planctomycetota bacterium]|jgi:sodium transport system permease protein|nr:ABC transporter permease subunit [Planctomycetota bacterium]
MNTPARTPGRRSRSILAVAHRDLLEFVRDRRTLFVTLLMPMAMYPVLALASTLGLRTALSDLEARQAPRQLVLILSGPEAVAFTARLKDVIRTDELRQRPDWPSKVAVEMVHPTQAQRLLDEGTADAWIQVAPGTLAALDGRGTVPLEARTSAIRPRDARRQAHLVAVMQALADDARQRRVEQAGLPPSVLEPVSLSFIGGPKAEPPASMEGIVPTAAGGVLVLLALLTATGAFYPAIDAIAGEKERGTIETLLIAPASPGEIVTGKFLAIWAVTLATLLVNAFSIAGTAAVLLKFLPPGYDLGIDAARTALTAGFTLVAFIGLAAVAAALCLAVTSGSRSGKEAQNTLTPVILLVSGLSGSALLPATGGLLFAMVPFAGQVSLTRSILAGEPAGMAAILLLISLVSAAAVTWLLLRAAAAALADEELLFRGPEAAGGLLLRPAPRRRPSTMQGFAAGLLAFAALWYSQGLAPENLALAIPFQQLALVLPLVALLAWQRVDLRHTFGLRLPRAIRWPMPAFAGLLLGAGLFIVAAAVTLAIRGSHLSSSARELAERIVTLIDAYPWPLSWALIAVLPAVCEEVFFRGWLLAAIAGDRPGPRRAAVAVVLQAAVFAGFHLLPERMPQTFMLGLVLGWLTLATGSLLPAVLAHLAHNSVPLVLVALADRHETRLALGDTSHMPGWLVAAAAVAALAGFSLIALSRRR